MDLEMVFIPSMLLNSYINHCSLTMLQPLQKMLHTNDLVLIFAEAWNNSKYDKIERFLDINFHYYSDWVFDVLPSRIEFLNYLDGKFETLRKNNIKPIFSTVENQEGQLALLFDQNGEKAFFTSKVIMVK